jgi:hypothetical protein
MREEKKKDSEFQIDDKLTLKVKMVMVVKLWAMLTFVLVVVQRRLHPSA